MIKLIFFLLGGGANALLQGGVADGDELPGLLIGSAGGRCGGADAVLNNVARDGVGGKVADRAAALQFRQILLGTLLHLIDSGWCVETGVRNHVGFL